MPALVYIKIKLILRIKVFIKNGLAILSTTWFFKAHLYTSIYAIYFFTTIDKICNLL